MTISKEELDKEVEKYRYLYDGTERSTDEMKAIRNFQKKRLKELKKMEKFREEDERIKKLTGDDFEEYYQKHIKDATEKYSSNMVYFEDKVDKHTAWEIWKTAWKVFEEKNHVVREI